MSRIVKILICFVSLMLPNSLTFAQEKKIIIGTGIEYFAADRIYDNTGETFVTDSTFFEFRIPLYMMYQYNKYLNLKLTIPYIYRKTEYIYSDYDKLGKGMGDIDIADEIIIKENIEKGLLYKTTIVLTIPAGTSDLKGALADRELPTGGPLFGSQGVYKYGGSYNINTVLMGEKRFKKNKYSANVGYNITLPVLSNGEVINPGDIFSLELGYGYAVNESTAIGIDYESFSSGRTKVGGTKLDYSPGIIGRLNPNFTVKLPRAELNFVLKIPIHGKNEYKGVGYSFNIVF